MVHMRFLMGFIFSGCLVFGATGAAKGGSVAIDLGGPEEQYLGDVDRQVVRTVIRGISKEIRACYVSGVGRGGGSFGKLVLSFDIAGTGGVSQVRVKTTTLKNSSVESCLTALVGRQTFSGVPADAVAQVEFPVTFNSQP